MKRKKLSIPPARVSQRCNNKAKGKVDDDDDDETLNHQLCPYFDYIPYPITTKILLKLPIKTLLFCKCVCKMWKTIISEPDFVKSHFEKTPVSLLIRTKDHNRVSRTLYLLESDPETFELGSDNRLKLQPIFKLPLRDARSLRERIMNKPKRPLRAVRLVSEKNTDKNSQMLNIDVKPHYDRFGMVNSCNGLLCLCCPFEGNPLVICNPVTGEFMRLPKATNTMGLSDLDDVCFGFGFQPKTNEYKVIRIWNRVVRHANQPRDEHAIFEINTLGMPSWRNVEVDSPVCNLRLRYPTCLNGVIHWIRYDFNKNSSILCFCLESERLRSFPSPPHVFINHNTSPLLEDISMGESRGLLYICNRSAFHNVTMWVMNEYGVEESWTKVYNIDTSISSLERPGPRYGLCWPLKHFEDGASASLLLYHSRNCLIYYEPEKYGFKVFRIHGTSSILLFSIIQHTPSLISLKDVVKGDNVEVLNIYSMCANAKLREENEVLLLSQQLISNLASTSSSSYRW